MKKYDVLLEEYSYVWDIIGGDDVFRHRAYISPRLFNSKEEALEYIKGEIKRVGSESKEMGCTRDDTKSTSFHTEWRNDKGHIIWWLHHLIVEREV